MSIPMPLCDPYLPAFGPCAGFGSCREAIWDPAAGHVPRGFAGAGAGLDAVRAILVLAEPGHPYPGDGFADLPPIDLMAETVRRTRNHVLYAVDPFHRNLRGFLTLAFPGIPTDDALNRVLLTETRLCSIRQEIGASHNRPCASRYLAKVISLLPGRPVIAFGGKAHTALSSLGISFIPAAALAPPGANRQSARDSWAAAATKIANHSLASAVPPPQSRTATDESVAADAPPADWASDLPHTVAACFTALMAEFDTRPKRLKLQTQLWVRDAQIGGWNRQSCHFYLLSGPAQSIDPGAFGFHLATHSSGRTWWQANRETSAHGFLAAVRAILAAV